jgi:hypothetical protein
MTGERIDHASIAGDWLDLVQDEIEGNPTGRLDYPQLSFYVQAAQAEATLALVEQQRVANLQAVVRDSGDRFFDTPAKAWAERVEDSDVVVRRHPAAAWEEVPNEGGEQ